MNKVLYVSKSRLKNTLDEYDTIRTSIATWKDRMETQNRNISESDEGATAETYTEKTTAYNENELTTLIGHVDQMRTALVEAHIKIKSLIARSEDFENILRGEGAESSDTYANISSSGDIASYYDDFCSQDGYTGAIKDNTDSIKELGIEEEENLTGIEKELKDLKTIDVSIGGQATHIRDCITKQNYTDLLYDSLKKYCIDIAIMHELVKYTRDMYFPVLDGPREHNRSYDYDGVPTEDKEDIYVMFLKEMGYSEEDIEVLKRYTGLTASRLYDQISHMPASEVSNMIKLAYAFHESIETTMCPEDVASMKIGDDYSKTLYIPKEGEVVEISRGTDYNPSRQMATVYSTQSWSVEYTVPGCNAKFPPSGFRSTRALNYVVENYETNRGESDILKVQIPEYGECFAGAMVAGFGEIGDIVKVKLNDGQEFQMLLVDTKCIEHEAKDLAPIQCQNYWGHGYMIDDDTVQLCVCEFVDAGDERAHSSAKFYPSGQDLLTGNSVESAEIIGHIDTVL